MILSTSRTVLRTTVLLGFISLVQPDLAIGEGIFGAEPGGRTVGGPGQTEMRGGSFKEIFTFLSRGPTPSKFVCVTGLNLGPGNVSVVFRSRIGESMTAEFQTGETRVVCAEMTGIRLDCHGQGSDCNFRWRIDDPRQ